jgi:cysteine desulfurase/selenocysteine lyase
VAVQAKPKLDAHALRADFPVFERPIHGKPLAYLDSANSSQKPRQLLDAMWEFYGYSYANIHRGVYDLAERATARFEEARDKVRALINAPSRREVIFTRNVTEAINLVAYSWGLANLAPGDVVVITELEHHANFVPWQQIAKRTGAELRAIPFDGNGELVLESLDELARAGQIKVVAANWISNTLGTINPVEKLTGWAHEQGAIMVVDAAQAVPHRPVDVQALGCDFLGFTSHKLCGPGGAGALFGRRELLEKMPPFEMGGEMIRSVALEKTTWNDLPYKFEAGTPAIAEAYGLGIAIDYVTGVGLEAIEEHEHELTAYALERLSELPYVTVYGPPVERRGGIISFNVDGVHPHDVAQVLDMDGIAVRAGHHCTQPLMTRLGVAATTRASFYLYSVADEVDRLVDGVKRVKEVLG